jgi:predicted dehydrogenase
LLARITPLCVVPISALQQSQKMHTLRVAIAGTGFMGWVHAEALRRVGVQLVGIVGSSPEKSRAAAHRLGIAKAYTSFDQLLLDADVQAVHIVTPNRLHFDMASQALRAGKHVMCEKPLAMTTRQSAELTQLAHQHGHLAAGVNYNIRFYPLCLEARQRVQSGAIGQVLHVTGSYLQDWLLYSTDYNWRVLSDEGGELRAVADIGTHWLDLVQAITGLQVKSVCADLKTVHRTRQRPRGEVETFKDKGKKNATVDREPIEVATDDYGCIMLRMQNGVPGCLCVSQVAAGHKNGLSFEIAGSQAALAWDSESPNNLWIGHRDQPNEQLIRDPALLGDLARPAADYPGGHNEGYADSFKQCFRAYYDYIRAGDFDAPPTFPTFADGHREVAICEAVLQSHQRQCWVEVEGVAACD